MRILSFFWKIIKNIKFFIITLLITFSLLVNIILFVGGTLYSVINKSFEAITGLSSIASKHKSEIADLNKNLITQKKLNKELKLEVADLSETLVNERKLKRDLKVEVADLSENLVNERKLKRDLKVEVADLSET